jgi:hypothetical protein
MLTEVLCYERYGLNELNPAKKKPSSGYMIMVNIIYSLFKGIYK